jgi:hypothetical protein
MGNYFEVTLDTSPPKVNIIMPEYTTTEIPTQLIVESDDFLSDDYVAYVIDANGEKVDITLTNKGKSLEGNFNFSGFPYGVNTFFVRVKDDVHNESPLVWRTFSILDVMSFQELDIITSESVEFKLTSSEQEELKILNTKEEQYYEIVNQEQEDLNIKTREDTEYKVTNKER